MVWATDRTSDIRFIVSASRGMCSQMLMPGTDVSHGRNSPRIAAGASGFMSHMSIVAGPPENTLLVATSNRRHLMARDHDEARDAIAVAEGAEEEVSVSDRFGLWISFPPMDQPTYLKAVRAYAGWFELAAPDLERRALQWSQLRGARSGRVAWQFTRDLAGELGKSLPF